MSGIRGKETRQKSASRIREARGGGGGGESSGSDSAASEATTMTSLEAIPDTLEGATEVFRSTLEALSEKRRETRVQALRKMAAFLAHRVSADLLDGCAETLAKYIGNSVKRGDADEQKFACRVAAVLFVTLGVDGEAVYNELAEPLVRLLTTGAADGAAAAALRALALGTFICSDDPTATQAMEERFHALFASESPTAGKHTLAAALAGHALLVTLHPPREWLESSFFTVIGDLSPLLDASAPEVRLAAGSSIALLFDMANEEKDAGGADVTTDVDARALAEQIDELAALSSRYMARAVRVEQRVFFREVKRVIDERARPELSLTVGSMRFQLGTWSQLAAFDALKDALGGGLNAHFAANPLIAQMFPSLALDTSRLSGVEKRAVKSPNSPQVRARDLSRGSARDRKAAGRAAGADD